MLVARRVYVLAVALAAAGALAVTMSARAVVSVLPCGASQLHLRFLGAQGAAGTLFYEFAFKNSGHACVIKGFPKLVLLDKHGHVVKAHVGHWTSHPVTQITIAHNKRAFFFVRYGQGGACSPSKRIGAARFKLFAPGLTPGTVFNVVPVLHGQASICRGTLQVSPLRLKASPGASDAIATPICAPSALRLDQKGGQGFTSHRELVLALRNVTGHTCHLKGYPGVAALDAHAAVLSPTATRVPASKPTIVLHTWQRAFFRVVYTVGGPCVPHTVTAFGLQVIPPGDTGHLVLYLGPTSLCAPPDLTVTPVSHNSAP
jgi:hypothetical protein